MLSAEEVSDQIEIAQVLQRYFRSMDEKDYELLETVFTPEATLHYDMQGGAKSTYREMVPRFREFNQHFCFTQHIMGHPLIELDGDRARSTNSLRAIHVQLTPEGEQNTWVVYGFYRDLHLRTPDGWRIPERYFKGVHFEGTLLPFDRVQRFPRPPWL